MLFGDLCKEADSLNCTTANRELKKPLSVLQVNTFLKYNNYTNSDFGKMLGISTRQATRILNGDRKTPGFSEKETAKLRYIMNNIAKSYDGSKHQESKKIKANPDTEGVWLKSVKLVGKISQDINKVPQCNMVGEATLTITDVKHQRTREAAYYLWLNAGCPEGRDVEFWHQAEKDIDKQWLEILRFEI